jgi:hypothetical protein
MSDNDEPFTVRLARGLGAITDLEYGLQIIFKWLTNHFDGNDKKARAVMLEAAPNASARRVFNALIPKRMKPAQRGRRKKPVGDAILVSTWEMWKIHKPRGTKAGFAKWWLNSAFRDQHIEETSLVRRLNRAISKPT